MGNIALLTKILPGNGKVIKNCLADKLRKGKVPVRSDRVRRRHHNWPRDTADKSDPGGNVNEPHPQHSRKIHGNKINRQYSNK